MAAASGDASGGATIVPRYGWDSPVMAFTDSKTASCTIAADRARANGSWPFATAVFTAISFQSKTTSAFATADPNNRVAIKMYRLRVLSFVSPCILFIRFLLFMCFLLTLHWLV